MLRDRGEVDSQVLRAELRVSAATLRRDLSELEEQGLLVRTHGGARALDPSGSEIPVRLRDHRMIAIKTADRPARRRAGARRVRRRSPSPVGSPRARWPGR